MSMVRGRGWPAGMFATMPAKECSRLIGFHASSGGTVPSDGEIRFTQRRWFLS